MKIRRFKPLIYQLPRNDRCVIDNASLSRARCPKRVGALLADRRGAAILEFALCASAFFGLLIGILQIAIVFFAQQGLQTSAETVARRILTGQVPATMTKDQFRAQACTQLPVFMNCTNLYVDVRKASNFSALDTGALSLTYDASGNITNTFAYDPGTAGSIVILRLLYRWPMGTAPLGLKLSNQLDGSRLLVGTMVFKSESYS